MVLLLIFREQASEIDFSESRQRSGCTIEQYTHIGRSRSLKKKKHGEENWSKNKEFLGRIRNWKIGESLHSSCNGSQSATAESKARRIPINSSRRKVSRKKIYDCVNAKAKVTIKINRPVTLSTLLSSGTIRTARSAPFIAITLTHFRIIIRPAFPTRNETKQLCSASRVTRAKQSPKETTQSFRSKRVCCDT